MATKGTGRLDDSDKSQCSRCEKAASVRARSEKFCNECFVSYVRSKVVKKIDSFRVKNNSQHRRRVLLALSGGVSSLSLLHVLDEQVKRQVSRTGRAGFELLALLVQEDTEDDKANLLAKLKETYAQHTFYVVTPDEGTTPEENNTTTDTHFTPAMTINTSSATSRSDFLQIRRNKTLVDQAKLLGCECILWGHTTTTLAEKVLAETAKGRGFGLPWLIKDGTSPLGVDFLYPMRDLLKKEIHLFANITCCPLTEPALSPCISRIPVSSKSSTIDSLMSDYFKDVEDNYPSIVANVVRTIAKLSTPENHTTCCVFCQLPLSGDQLDVDSWAGNQDTAGPATSQDLHERDSCYGCMRAFREPK